MEWSRIDQSELLFTVQPRIVNPKRCFVSELLREFARLELELTIVGS